MPPLGGRKVTLKLCTWSIFKGFQSCYCCQNQKPQVLCYSSRDECQSVCPTCNPICPHASSPIS
ncbi:hypothetical protein HU200_011786 [Digitaria exilis]|uniref:Uncharacterized protein n=1 Tax=Digitaria exilis TaxID=1010633 RepID=A0A835FHL3_9POAL|nr:hypothetical protein HU200_011786 [Digitaria exilis]